MNYLVSNIRVHKVYTLPSLQPSQASGWWVNCMALEMDYGSYHPSIQMTVRVLTENGRRSKLLEYIFLAAHNLAIYCMSSTDSVYITSPWDTYIASASKPLLHWCLQLRGSSVSYSVFVSTGWAMQQ